MQLIRDCEYMESSICEGAVRLRIKQVTADDEGIYTCEAANSLGKASSSACLIVYRESVLLRNTTQSFIRELFVELGRRENLIKAILFKALEQSSYSGILSLILLTWRSGYSSSYTHIPLTK